MVDIVMKLHSSKSAGRFSPADYGCSLFRRRSIFRKWQRRGQLRLLLKVLKQLFRRILESNDLFFISNGGYYFLQGFIKLGWVLDHRVVTGSLYWFTMRTFFAIFIQGVDLNRIDRRIDEV